MCLSVNISISSLKQSLPSDSPLFITPILRCYSDHELHMVFIPGLTPELGYTLWIVFMYFIAQLGHTRAHLMN